MPRDQEKTKTQLIAELQEARKENSQLKTRLAESKTRVSQRSRSSRELFEKLPLGYQSLDEQGVLLAANASWLKMLGYNREEVIGQYFSNFLRPEWREHFQEYFPQFKANGEILGIEFEMVRKDGNFIHVSLNGRISYDEEGTFQHSHCLLQDITEYKSLEVAMRRSESYYRAIFETSGAATVILEKDFSIILANSEAVKLTGYSRQELEGMKASDFIHSEDLKRMMEYHYLRRQDPSAAPRKYSFRLVDRSWNVRLISCLVDLIPGTSQSVVSFIDFTETKELEKRLRRNQDFLDAILDSVQDGISIIDTDLTIRRVNKTMRRWYALNEPLEGKKCYVAYHNAKEPCFLCPTRRCFQTGRTEHEEFPGIPGSQAQWLELYSHPMKDEAGRVNYVVEFVRDITRRRQAEEELRESEERFRIMLDKLPGGVFAHDLSGRILFVNEMACKNTGYSKDELLGMSVADIDPDSSVRDDPSRFWNEMGLGEKVIFESTHIRKDGSLYPTEIHLTMMVLQGKHILVPIAFDITERKEAEESIRRMAEEQALLLESVPTQIWYLLDPETYGAVNQAHADFCGLRREEMVSRRLKDVLPEDEASVCFERNIQVFQRKESLQTEEWLHDALGNQRLLEISRTPKLTASGEVEYVVCAGTDITDRKWMEEQLRQLSLCDSLTGLYNRTFFDLEMKRLSDKRYLPVGIVVCDLDGLKFVNDTLGHTSGDEMISNAASILKQCIRSSEIIARIGGDEFAILLPRIDEESIKKFVQRLRRGAEEFNAKGVGIPVSLSIGYAVGCTERTDMQVLFRVADNRMYREKIQKEESPRSAIVRGLTKAFEAKDFVTNGHCSRLQKYAVSLARVIGLSEDRINDLCLFARFHDLGKVGIYDHILFKSESLTEDESLEMRKHSEVGHRIAQSLPDLAFIADWILKHHERWDGRGYPLGLQGRDIPLECRILAIVDAFDVMTHDRPYHYAMSQHEAVKELRRCAGTQFDPDLVEQFIQVLDLNNIE